ncbi:hypothetical protein ACO22_03382 [Paracoccidioides brasiliensis]|uniref:Polymerase nucleotidyl transferase domain-containing protein n=1 Tax=Paracoccidioides brasiliensis TaxID=121759 RepID=A0A1D2JG16_PARBR|nr:hypothetical protein ACO22_03382 [Paracoccidioides brasiliensis]
MYLLTLDKTQSINPKYLSIPMSHVWIYPRARRRYHDASSHWRRKTQPEVVPSSLEETLRSHRFANRQTLIRKLPARESANPGMIRPKLNPDRFVPTEALKEQEVREADLHQILNEDGGAETRFDVLSIRSPNSSPMDPTKPNILWTKDTIYHRSTEYPWLSYLEESGSGSISRLSDEITAFEKYILPTREERDAVGRVQRDAIASLKFDEMNLPILTGSRRTGMAVPHSSVDFVILIEDPERVEGGRGPSATRPMMVQARLKRLHQIEDALKESKTLSKVMLRKEKNPTLSAVHAATGLQVQFQCATSPPASTDFILNYRAEFPTLRPLFMVLRMLLETRGFLGGDASSVDPYLLTMMIVAALKIQEGKYHRRNIGSQFLHVLEFYKDTDFTKYGVSVEPPGIFEKNMDSKMRDKKGKRLLMHEPYLRGQRSIGKRSLSLPRAGMLSLQDPTDFMNDLGCKASVIPEVKQLFQALYDDLRARMKSWDYDKVPTDRERISFQDENSLEKSEKPPSPSLLSLALGMNYEDFERFRDKLLLAASQAGHVPIDEVNSDVGPCCQRSLEGVKTHMESWPSEKI